VLPWYHWTQLVYIAFVNFFYIQFDPMVPQVLWYCEFIQFLPPYYRTLKYIVKNPQYH
jgi:hypothetical protein